MRTLKYVTLGLLNQKEMTIESVKKCISLLD